MSFSQSGSNATRLEIVGRFFYIINPMTHMHKDIKDVPDYIVDVSHLLISCL